MIVVCITFTVTRVKGGLKGNELGPGNGFNLVEKDLFLLALDVTQNKECFGKQMNNFEFISNLD